MTALIDLTGQVFGRLTVLSKGPNTPLGQARWVCRCACGTEKTFIGSNLRRGRSLSCGCLRGERLGMRNKLMLTTHGASRTAAYATWKTMIRRCEKPTDPAYKDYGARGITVCERWRGPNGFTNFQQDMGPRPSPMHSHERVDNNLGYEPANCIWATPQQQSENRRVNIMVERDGVRKPLATWARIFGVSTSVVYKRWYTGVRGEELFHPTRSARQSTT